MKRILSGLLALLVIAALAPSAAAEALAVESQACLLMEKTTGQVLYAVNEHEQLEPASVTRRYAWSPPTTAAWRWRSTYPAAWRPLWIR